ncbi:uncharacterized protein EAF02_003084 [Botrytis sinoallii]|uniref:uncharacterized protein n=1 Tax=Botrytis sinoallii TaxID=1463999 RepID=UPI00190181AF|nr:uncharacterized protein EAF02_003084 [Botrytis sinoallii]KAF7888543.1 hypothetical protein EAF02_003084 [Botrytis sinoallii]
MQGTSRKPHRKVRTGCRVCKTRKIKCDENKPSCNNCIRHSVQCDIIITSAAVTPAASVPSPSPSFSGGGTPMNTFSPMSTTGSSISTHQMPLPSISMLDSQAPNFTLLDMELLHHYTISTSMTLASSPPIRILWRINIPQLSYSHEFLMRGLMALGALHIAYYKPEKRDLYVARAVFHHQKALADAIPMMSDLNDENCTPLYVFTTLTLVYSIASPRKPLDLLIVGDNDVSDWVSLLRGARALTDHSPDSIYSGSLSPMFTAGGRRDRLRNDQVTPPNEDLIHLATFLSQSTTDPQDLEAYIQSIDELQKSFGVLANRDRHSVELADVFIWPYRVHEHYLVLLRQRNAEALTIFAHFAVLLKHLDSYWYMKGWSEYLIAQIWGLLDDEHRLWIRGPIEEIGWVP